MTKDAIEKSLRLLSVATVLIPLTACFHNDDDDAMHVDTMDAMVSYEIMINNATNGQPLTPLAVVVHTANYQPWSLGAAASLGLEMAAEGGDLTVFLAAADADANVVASVSSANGPFGPGATETVTIQVAQSSALQISMATMLANTNDAFTGVANLPIGDLQLGEHRSLLAHVYDAGTEGNSETSATMPGPVAGGEGFNAARDDTNFVSIHGGVVTVDDGLTTSALTESHRWIGPAAKITITRTQ